jgi:uncharacterized protein (DUF433 family)
MPAALQQHITFDKRGRPVIDGTRLRVTQIALFAKDKGWSAKQIQKRWYQQLSLGQIHAALSYYYDHQEAMDAAIDAELRETDELLEKLVDPQSQAKLRAAVAKMRAKKRHKRDKQMS